MNPEELKSIWQSQTPGRLEIDESLILRQVVRTQKDFRTIIISRDVLEISVGILLIPVFLYFYFNFSDHPWPLLLIVAAIIWIIGFLLVDRFVHRKRHPHHEDTIKTCAESALADINHQIWLLKNVFWWYMLPPLATMEMWFAYVMIHTQTYWLFLLCQLLLLTTFTWVYFLNQKAVKKDLEPRRQELETLLRGLQSDQ